MNRIWLLFTDTPLFYPTGTITTAFLLLLLTLYSLFSIKQSNWFFEHLNGITSLPCSKPYNGSQLTLSKSQSPDSGKICPTEMALHHSEISTTLHLAHCSATLPSLCSWTLITFLLHVWTVCFTWNTLLLHLHVDYAFISVYSSFLVRCSGGHSVTTNWKI